MAGTASNLSELELRLGKVEEAGRDAEQSVTFADRSGDAFQRTACRVAHADALHQAGRFAEAEAHFREAEIVHAKHQPHYPHLYSVSGYQYCEVLLSKAEQEAVRIGAKRKVHALGSACDGAAARATEALEIVLHASGNPLDVALNRLTLGRSAIFTAILESRTQYETATAEIAEAVRGLRSAGYQEYLVPGLVTQALLRSLTGPRTGEGSAQSDLDEAWEIAARGPMPLFQADIHLHRARLFFREPKYPWQSAQHDLAEARRLIFKHGYFRRKEELEDAEAAILK
jgi:tetratricopeptide (TPR) repeat protein